MHFLSSSLKWMNILIRVFDFFYRDILFTGYSLTYVFIYLTFKFILPFMKFQGIIVSQKQEFFLKTSILTFLVGGRWKPGISIKFDIDLISVLRKNCTLKFIHTACIKFQRNQFREKTKVALLTRKNKNDTSTKFLVPQSTFGKWNQYAQLYKHGGTFMSLVTRIICLSYFSYECF